MKWIVFQAVLSFLLIGVWVPCALGQQCDVVVTSQAALNKELKALLDNLDVQVDGNISCSNMCENIAGKIESFEARFGENLRDRLDEILAMQQAKYLNLSEDIMGKIESLEAKLNDSLDERFHEMLIVQKSIVEQVLLLQTQLFRLHRPGTSSSHPAPSCFAVLQSIPGSRSGYYWIENSPGHSVQQYCDMTRSCGGVTGGWRRVAELDMTNSSHQCPSGLRQHTDSNKRTCVRNSDSAGCSSVTISAATVGYSRVCGRIRAYQIGSTNAFSTVGRGSNSRIDSYYVDGVSLTHGVPRQHIWSFASGLHETSSFSTYNCPCIANVPEIQPPSFVGSDYFCDTGSTNHYTDDRFYGADPLWDGAGCGPQNTCCSFNNPPWFSKQLPRPTTDDIEMRVCMDQETVGNQENVGIEQVEIYVHALP